MSTLPHVETLTTFHLHPATRMGHVHLTVANLDRQIEFYQQFIGLKQHWRKDSTAGLGVGGEDLLRLTESRSARRIRGTTGLYHFALLMPDRRELARAIGRLFSLDYPNYPTDHILTKSTYVDDLEGNNIEIYTESPEDGVFEVVNSSFVVRHADGTPSDGREAIDVEAFMHNLLPGDRLDDAMPPTTRMGHFHLFVANWMKPCISTPIYSVSTTRGSDGIFAWAWFPLPGTPTTSDSTPGLARALLRLPRERWACAI